MNATTSKTLGYLTGIGSVLDMSGYSAHFRHLCSRKIRSPNSMEVIGEDFSAVRTHLEKALLEYAKCLSVDQKAVLLRALRRSEDRYEEGHQYLLWETEDPIANSEIQKARTENAITTGHSHQSMYGRPEGAGKSTGRDSTR